MFRKHRKHLIKNGDVYVTTEDVELEEIPPTEPVGDLSEPWNSPKVKVRAWVEGWSIWTPEGEEATSGD
jgi:hypothetical protein